MHKTMNTSSSSIAVNNYLRLLKGLSRENKIKMFNGINMRSGYPLVDRRSPFGFLKI